MKGTDVISKFLEAMRLGKSEEEAEFIARNWSEACEMHPQGASKHDLEIAVERINSTMGKILILLTTIGLAIVADIIRRLPL